VDDVVINEQAFNSTVNALIGYKQRGIPISPGFIRMIYKIDLAKLNGTPIPPTEFVRDAFEIDANVIAIEYGVAADVR
jgi:hypothetical protein